jgi:hypothetical protein
MNRLLRLSGLVVTLFFSYACSGGGGTEDTASGHSLRFKGGEEFSATLSLLESSSEGSFGSLVVGEVIGESAYDPIHDQHEIVLSALENYQVEVSTRGVPIFKTLVLSDELLSGTGPLDLGFINAGSTFFTELTISESDAFGKWNQLMTPYGMLDAYSGRRDVRLSSLLENDNPFLSTREKQTLGLRILAARLFLRLLEARDAGDAFWALKYKSDAELWTELVSGVEQAMSSGEADLLTFFNNALGPYYAKYRPLADHLEDQQGVEHLAVKNTLENSFSLPTSAIPELVGVQVNTVGVLQRWNVWDEFASLLATMAAGDLLSAGPFAQGEELFKVFDDRSTGSSSSEDAFEDSFGYDRYLVGARVSLIILTGTGSSPISLVNDLDLNP